MANCGSCIGKVFGYTREDNSEQHLVDSVVACPQAIVYNTIRRQKIDSQDEASTIEEQRTQTYASEFV